MRLEIIIIKKDACSSPPPPPPFFCGRGTKNQWHFGLSSGREGGGEKKRSIGSIGAGARRRRRRRRRRKGENDSLPRPHRLFFSVVKYGKWTQWGTMGGGMQGYPTLLLPRKKKIQISLGRNHFEGRQQRLWPRTKGGGGGGGKADTEFFTHSKKKKKRSSWRSSEIAT